MKIGGKKTGGIGANNAISRAGDNTNVKKNGNLDGGPSSADNVDIS